MVIIVIMEFVVIMGVGFRELVGIGIWPFSQGFSISRWSCPSVCKQYLPWRYWNIACMSNRAHNAHEYINHICDTTFLPLGGKPCVHRPSVCGYRRIVRNLSPVEQVHRCDMDVYSHSISYGYICFPVHICVWIMSQSSKAFSVQKCLRICLHAERTVHHAENAKSSSNIYADEISRCFNGDNDTRSAGFYAVRCNVCIWHHTRIIWDSLWDGRIYLAHESTWLPTQRVGTMSQYMYVYFVI